MGPGGQTLAGLTPTIQFDHAYDRAGNLRSSAASIGIPGDFVADFVNHYAYDTLHRPTQITQSAQAGGNSVAPKRVDFAYDADSRLQTISRFSDLAGVQNEVESRLAYDVFNRPIGRTVDPDGTVGLGAIEQTFYLYDQGQIALEFRKTGAGAVQASDLRHRYLWGPAVDMLLADEQTAGAQAGETLWALTDHLGSVRDLVDNGGQVRLHRQFDAFGNISAEIHYNGAGQAVGAGAAGYVDTAFGFTGKYFETYTGLQQNWHRWYDPRVGRWLSEDPIGFGGGDGNVYRYVGNGSTTSLDYDGLVKTDERWWDNGATDKYNPFAYVAAFGHFVGDRVGDAASSLYCYDSGRAQRRLQEVCVHNGRDPRGHQKLDHFADNLIRNAAAGSIQFTASAGMFVTGAGGGGLAGGAGGSSDDLARAGAAKRAATVFRVQGGVLPNASKVRFVLDDAGKIAIQGDDMLFINVNQQSRALEFLAKRGEGANLCQFQIKPEFLDKLRRLAVDQRVGRQFPGRPQLVDPTRSPDQFGIPSSMFDELLENIIPGTGGGF
jgi:RHS repeat-associated protein